MIVRDEVKSFFNGSTCYKQVSDNSLSEQIDCVTYNGKVLRKGTILRCYNNYWIREGFYIVDDIIKSYEEIMFLCQIDFMGQIGNRKYCPINSGIMDTIEIISEEELVKLTKEELDNIINLYLRNLKSIKNEIKKHKRYKIEFKQKLEKLLEKY